MNRGDIRRRIATLSAIRCDCLDGYCALTAERCIGAGCVMPRHPLPSDWPGMDDLDRMVLATLTTDGPWWSRV